MLCQGQPRPHRVARNGLMRRILAKVTQEMPFELVVRATQAGQACPEVATGIGHAAEGKAGAEAPQSGVPRALVEVIMQLVPARRADIVHDTIS